MFSFSWSVVGPRNIHFKLLSHVLLSEDYTCPGVDPEDTLSGKVGAARQKNDNWVGPRWLNRDRQKEVGEGDGSGDRGGGGWISGTS